MIPKVILTDKMSKLLMTSNHRHFHIVVRYLNRVCRRPRLNQMEFRAQKTIK